MCILVTGATGFTGTLFLEHLAKNYQKKEIYCLIRTENKPNFIDELNLKINYVIGDSSTAETWQQIFSEINPNTIIHIASIRHLPVILKTIEQFTKKPRLIIVGTTGIYSNFNEYSGVYKNIEQDLKSYSGLYCLLRPTMIYGSNRDKNLHKLIKFCHKYGFFFIFGSGECLLQPVHADDLAQAILFSLEHPKIQGFYDLSGGSVVSFKELLLLVSKLLNKPIYQVSFSLNLGIFLATILEKFLGLKSPVRREQILRLQEDKAYSNEAAKKDLNFQPRTLEIGLKEEIEILSKLGII